MSTSAPPSRSRSPYSVWRVAGLLAFFAATCLLLDSNGLVTWAQRMAAGRVQDVWLSWLVPLDARLARLGLTRPRAALVAFADRYSPVVSGEGDALALAEQDVSPASSATPAGAEVPPSGAAAPGGDAPPTPLTPRPPRSGPITLLLIGDSMMAVGLSPALVEALENRPQIQVVRAHRSATGLSQPQLLDWPKAVSKLIERYTPQAAVVVFGGNDTVDLRNAKGRRVEYGTPEWDVIYRERIHAMMTLLADHGCRVLWLGQPIMRAKTFDGRMAHLNQLYEEEAKSVPGVSFKETRSLLQGPDGTFTTFARNAKGKRVRLRLDDGIHLTPEGGWAITQSVLDWLAQELAPEPAVAPGAAAVEGSIQKG